MIKNVKKTNLKSEKELLKDLKVKVMNAGPRG
jgi:hypothetical protein